MSSTATSGWVALVVHVPGQPQPFFVRRQLGDRPARPGQLLHQLYLHPEPDHGQADQQHGQQHGEEVPGAEVTEPAEERIAGSDYTDPEQRHAPGGSGPEHHAAGGGHVDPQRRPVLAIDHAGHSG
jgi:hypothetical protein